MDLCNANDTSPSDVEDGKQVVVGICAMAKKSQSKPMKEILTRLQEFEYIKMLVFPEEVILKVSVLPKQKYGFTSFILFRNRLKSGPFAIA